VLELPRLRQAQAPAGQPMDGGSEGVMKSGFPQETR
jgi:hypothetical protein